MGLPSLTWVLDYVVILTRFGANRRFHLDFLVVEDKGAADGDMVVQVDILAGREQCPQCWCFSVRRTQLI